MKKSLLCLLALSLLALPAAAKKKSKKEKKEEAASGATIDRTLCGVELRMSVKDLESKLQVREVTEVYKRMLPEGDRMFSIQGPKLETGASGCLAQLYNDHVWRVEATFPPAHAKHHSLDPMIEEKTKAFGEPEKTEVSNDKLDRTKLIFKDASSRLVIVREIRGKDSPVPSEMNRPYQQIAVEDIALSLRPKKEEGAAKP